MNPLVSIIIPTYNRPEAVKRAITSALKQTYVPTEILVVDDGSDVPYEVLPSAVRYIRYEQNRGKSAVMNDAVKEAKGEYIVFLDDDNVFYPDFLSVCVKYMSEYDVVTTSRDIEGIEEPARIRLTPFTAIDWGWLMRKKDYLGYDESIYGDEDADYGIRFFAKGYTAKVVCVPYQLAYDTTSPQSFTYPSERRLRGLERFMAKHIEQYRKYPNELRYLYRLAGRNWYKAGYRLKGLSYFWRSFFAHPTWKSFTHLFFIHFGWAAYDKFMTYEERR